ncbi:MAG TPA: nucleobase:cation symporter-2 family protein [Candidatus Wallbacteria bacterium]|nr:nucleobase:cation symporter-2 family protein [Candidatus Wallbacteria bacterium]
MLIQQNSSSNPPAENTDIIYGLNARPPFTESLFVALQHFLAIFVPIITPTLVIAGALNFNPEDTAYMINMSLFVSGLATFVQVYKIGPMGSGLLSIQGTSFSFVSAVITAGKIGGLPLIFGLCFIGSFIEMIISRFIKSAQKIFTPLVSGLVVTMIGVSLIKVGVINCAGGAAARADGTFATAIHYLPAGLVLLSIVFMNRSSNKYLRMSSIITGLLAGCVYASFKGMITFASLKNIEWICVPIPFKYGFSFDAVAFIPFILIYILTTIETIGDLTATSLNSKEPIEGKVYMERISGGVLADGFNSLLAAVFNTFPNTTFSQNNGIIQMTGVASRYVGFYIASFLVLTGLFPFTGAVFALVPPAVLGGATLIMFGTIAAGGIRIISTAELGRRSVMIIALTFCAGIGVEAAPEILVNFPDVLKNVLSSGITAGGLTAIISNIVLPDDKK